MKEWKQKGKGGITKSQAASEERQNSKVCSLMVFFADHHGTTEMFFINILKIQVEALKKNVDSREK